MLSPGISSIIERSAFPLHCRHTHKKRISLLSLSKRPETLLVFRVLFGLDLLFPSCFRRVNSQHSMDAFQGKKKVGTTTKMRPSLTSGMTSWRSSTGGGRSGPTPGCFGGDFIVHSLGGGGGTLPLSIAGLLPRCCCHFPAVQSLMLAVAHRSKKNTSYSE